MGLFGNSVTKEKKEQILRDVIVVNKALRQIGEILDGGINRISVNNCSSIIDSIESNISRISKNVQTLRDSELSGFSVPWKDGRYLGIMMWMSTFQMVMKNVVTEMKGVE